MIVSICFYKVEFQFFWVFWLCFDEGL